MKPVIFHPRARAELDQAVAYYEKRKAGLGLDLQADIEEAVQAIRVNPLLGSPYKRSGLRHWILRRFPYVIFYADSEHVLWIAAVALGSRRPNYWIRRKR